MTSALAPGNPLLGKSAVRAFIDRGICRSITPSLCPSRQGGGKQGGRHRRRRALLEQEQVSETWVGFGCMFDLLDDRDTRHGYGRSVRVVRPESVRGHHNGRCGAYEVR